MSAYEKASSYQLPLWPPLYHLVGVVANLLSAYGSGYAYFYFFSIGDNITELFPYNDIRFWVAFIIGGIVQAVLWDIATSQGMENMREYLREKDEKKTPIGKLREKTTRFTLALSCGKAAGRYSAILGMSIILFTQISYFQQRVNVDSDLLHGKEADLKAAKATLEKTEAIDIEQTQTYQDMLADKNDGKWDNDPATNRRIDSLLAAHRTEITFWRGRVDDISNEIESAKRATVVMDATALFRFLGGNEYLATLILLFSVWAAAFMIDEGCFRYGIRIGERRTCKNILSAVNGLVYASVNGVNGVNVTENVNGNGKRGGNSYGIDFTAPKNQAILDAIKNNWQSVRNGKTVSLQDIGDEFDTTKQYIFNVKEAAKEEGLYDE